MKLSDGRLTAPSKRTIAKAITGAFFLSLALPAVAQVASADQLASAWSTPDKELMVPVEGGEVYVRVNGDVKTTDKTPAIFIHGGPGGTHAPFASMLGLADERPIILYDQLGSGKSDRPNDPANWRIERFVDELETIRQVVGAEKLHLIGASWGSAVALEYAVQYPDHVASMVFAGTFISAPHWLTDANILLAEMEEEDRAVVHACEGEEPPSPGECRAAFNKVYSKYYQPIERPEELAEYAKVNGGEGFNPVIYNGMWGPSEFASTGILKNYDATLKLLKIDGRRAMFMIGQYDSARIDTIQEFVGLAPGAELAVVPGGSHGFIIDRPHETEALLRGWLRRQDNP